MEERETCESDATWTAECEYEEESEDDSEDGDDDDDDDDDDDNDDHDGEDPNVSYLDEVQFCVYYMKFFFSWECFVFLRFLKQSSLMHIVRKNKM